MMFWQYFATVACLGLAVALIFNPFRGTILTNGFDAIVGGASLVFLISTAAAAICWIWKW